jgi:nicotinamide riboside kinase
LRIGFVGAHRTGKTTLAKAIAEELKLDPILSGTSEIVAKHGFNMATDNRLLSPSGIAMQMEIIDALYDGQVGDCFVADRTPIDAAAYLLADAVAPANFADEEVVQYVEKATRETFKRFDLLVLIPPAIEFEARPDKPPFNRAYQFHHHTICRGLLLEHPDLLTTAVEMPWEVTSLKARVHFVRGHIREAASARKVRLATRTTEIY